MALVVPGDIVAHLGIEWVVVDVTDDGFAVLRKPNDLDLQQPTVAAIGDLAVNGHTSGVPGWVETHHGVWEKSE